MVVFRAGAERKQAFLFRLVDIANELFAMSASVSRAEALRARGAPRGRPRRDGSPTTSASRPAARCARSSAPSGGTTTPPPTRIGREVLAGEHAWLEQGGIGLGLTVEDLRPKAPEARLEAQADEPDERSAPPPAPSAVPVA